MCIRDRYNETVHDLHEKLTKKEISSVELTEKVFDRIDKVEDSVKAYITLDLPLIHI